MSMHLTLMGNASRGLPRTGLVALYDPYRDACGLDATARAALQTGVDYSGRGNSLTYGATTNASTDDPTNTGTAWSFDGGDFLQNTISGISANGARSILAVFTSTTGTTGANLANCGEAGTRAAFGISKAVTSKKLQCYTYGDDLASSWVLDANSHIACGTYDGARGVRLYYDANVPATKTLGGDLNVTDTKFCVGKASWGTTNYWDASIYLVAYYNRCLTTAEYYRIQRYLKGLMALRGVTLA